MASRFPRRAFYKSSSNTPALSILPLTPHQDGGGTHLTGEPGEKQASVAQPLQESLLSQSCLPAARALSDLSSVMPTTSAGGLSPAEMASGCLQCLWLMECRPASHMLVSICYWLSLESCYFSISSKLGREKARLLISNPQTPSIVLCFHISKWPLHRGLSHSSGLAIGWSNQESP